MSQNNGLQDNEIDFRGLVRSMGSAIATGVVLASFAILVYSVFSRPAFFQTDNEKMLKVALIETGDENEENGEWNSIDDSKVAFSSHISNEIIYSSDKEIFIAESKSRTGPVESKKNISAKSYYVIDLSDDKTIIQKNEDLVLPIASITKLVTAVTARKLINQEKKITITQEIAETHGNEAKFKVGEKISAKDILYPLLMVSSNDAGEALAKSYVGGRSAFISEMNKWANSIGAYKTYFADPTGLSPQNVSTAEDIAIITKWILKNDPAIFDITATKTKVIANHTWINPTRLLNLSVFAGGKYGYTAAANRTSVTLFKIGKQKKLFGIILLGSSSRDTDTLDLLDEAVM